MYVDDLSLLKRLSHDVVQFFKWDIRFQVFSPHILAGVYHFLVADLFFLPLVYACCTPLWDRCNSSHCESALI